jgi:hypothetical protein
VLKFNGNSQWNAAKPTSGRHRPPGPVVPIQKWVVPYLAIPLDKVNRGSWRI